MSLRPFFCRKSHDLVPHQWRTFQLQDNIQCLWGYLQFATGTIIWLHYCKVYKLSWKWTSSILVIQNLCSLSLISMKDIVLIFDDPAELTEKTKTKKKKQLENDQIYTKGELLSDLVMGRSQLLDSLWCDMTVAHAGNFMRNGQVGQLHQYLCHPWNHDTKCLSSSLYIDSRFSNMMLGNLSHKFLTACTEIC